MITEKKAGSLEKKLDILVVDDGKDNLESATYLLKGYADRLDTAGTFEEARHFLKNNKYDVVLTDDNMPLGDVVPDEDGRAYDPLRSSPMLRKMTGSYGMNIAMLAMKHGVYNIAISSDTNHHAGVGAYLIEDVFRHGSFDVGDAKINLDFCRYVFACDNKEINAALVKYKDILRNDAKNIILPFRDGMYFYNDYAMESVWREYADASKEGKLSDEDSRVFEIVENDVYEPDSRKTHFCGKDWISPLSKLFSDKD